MTTRPAFVVDVNQCTGCHACEMACRIAERLGYSTDLVVATDSNAMEGRAPRPNDASLDITKARSVLETPMQTLMSGLDLVIASKEKQKDG